MAQKIVTTFTDDIDGSEAEGTVWFGLDGTDYEIDLSARHAQALRGTLARYVEAARKNRGPRRPSLRGHRERGTGLNTTEIREWAKSQGIEVKDRGRISAGLVAQFKAAATGK